MEPDPFIQAIFTELPNLDAANPVIITNLVQPVLMQHRPAMLELSNHIRRASATIVEPSNVSDVALKFTAGLTIALQLDVLLENVEEIDCVRLRVSCSVSGRTGVFGCV